MSEATQENAFPETPEGWAKRWAHELGLAHKHVGPWHKQAAKVVARYRDDRPAGDGDKTRWNLFTSNTDMQEAMLYGQTPKAAVTRKHADAQDDVARVAGNVLERVVNLDLERDSDTTEASLRYALQDWLLVGFGLARVRYEVETETGEATPARIDEQTGEVLAPEVPGEERVAYECVETDYVHWRDIRWSAGARTWEEVRWIAFRAEMSREQLVERFGKAGQLVPLNASRKGDDSEDKKRTEHPWDRAAVWELWSKEHKRVFWVVEGHGRTLDEKDDPLELDGFFPCPKPLVRFATTSEFLPKPEFAVVQDLYDEVDDLSARIKVLTDAVKVAGCYDKTLGNTLQEMLDASGNVLVPVESWAALAEKGGLRGVIDWLPLDQIVGAIAQLSERRMVAKDAIFEITGQADIMRGASGVPGETATTSAAKTRFGSVRIQRKQDEFAGFASQLARLKAEVVAKFFQPETIIEQSNVMHTPDAQFAQAAVDLIKSQRSMYRVEVKPESVALQDFAALKSEALELMQGIAGFLQSLAPLMAQSPAAMPFALELLQASLARLRGAQAFESIIDRAIEAAKQAAQQPQQQAPDPKLQAIAMKGQQEKERDAQKFEHDMMRLQAEVQADAQREQTQARWNTMEAQAKASISQAARAANPNRQPGGAP